MKILVTGVTGFLGSVLAEALLRKHYLVVGIGKNKFSGLSERCLKNKNFTFFQHDLCSPLNAGGFEGIDCIIHCAGLIRGDIFDDFYNQNVLTTRRCLEFAVGQNISQFIYISTNSIFGKENNKKYFSEDSAVNPNDYYGLTKYIAERFVLMPRSGRQMQRSIIRCPAIIGNSSTDNFVHSFFYAARRNLPIVVYGDGKNYRNIITIDDVVSCIIRIIDKKSALECTEVFQVGSRNSVKILDIAKAIKKITHSTSDVVLFPQKATFDFDVRICTAKAKNILGARARTIRSILKQLFDEKYGS